MSTERMIAIGTTEYKILVKSSIQLELLWKKCKQLRKDGMHMISIDEVAFQLEMDDDGGDLPWETVPQNEEKMQDGFEQFVVDGRN